MAIAGKLMREAAHVAGALHVVLPAQGFTPTPRRPMLPWPWPDWQSPSRWRSPGCARSRQGRNRSPHCRLWQTAAPPAQILCRNARDGLQRLRAVARVGHEARPVGELIGIATLAMKALSSSPSVTITWASAVITATLVPGCSGRW
jgi:hypothetical protein